MPGELPNHKHEPTGNVVMDRIQDNVRQVIAYLRDTFWLTRRVYVPLLTDASTSSATYATLMEGSITTTQGKSNILIDFHMSGSRLTNTATTYFLFLVDGVVTKGFYQSLVANYGYSGSFQYRVPVSQGTHRVIVQWKTDAASSQILAKSFPNEYATLHLSEEV